MDDQIEYRFKIDTFTPATLPMKRLAEYMLEIAQLLGEPEHVHFVEVAEGSAQLVQLIDYVAIPKVRDRLRTSITAAAPEELVRRRNQIDKMLAADNAVGVLHEVGHATLVIRFPGRELISEEIAGIAEEGSLRGQLVRIGGSDNTAHALISNDEGTFTCEMPRDLARALAPHLYGMPIRIDGRGRWRRSREGRWELQHFRATSFVVLKDEVLMGSVARLRDANKDGALIERGLTADELLRIRHGQ